MKQGVTPVSVTLALHGRDASAYGVCWFTADAGEPIVQYTEERDVRFKSPVTVSAEAREYRGRVRNTAVLEKLLPGVRYRWRVGDRSGVFSPAEVMTAIPDSEESLCFTVYSDTQDRAHFGKWLSSAWRDAKANFPHSALTLHAGDIVDHGEDHLMWERMMRWGSGLFCASPMLPATGNHDHFAEKDGVMHPYFNVTPPVDKSEPLMYYSTDAGPVHFTVLCSGDYGYTERHGLKTEQIEWAKKDITSTDKKWKVVMIHTPFYSPGKYGSAEKHQSQPVSLRAQLNEIFADAGVDLVISGHDHIFSESYPIMGDSTVCHTAEYIIKRKGGKYYRLAVAPAGPIHILPGCAGNQNRPVECEMDAEKTAYFKDIVEIPRGCVSYVAVDIKGNLLTAEFVLVSAQSGERVITRRFGIQK